MIISRREFGIGMAGLAQVGRVKAFDVIVVGAGVFGAWIAHECRLWGWSVLLLDFRGPANSTASSGGESRILRVGYGAQIAYSRWALHSLTRWKDFLRRAHGERLLLTNGVLWLGPKDETFLTSTISSLRELRVPFEVIDSGNLKKRYPQISAEAGYIGILEPNSGTILARRAVELLVEIAVSQGVSYRIANVLPPEASGRLSLIHTLDGETIHGERFVFACGPWLPKVFPEVVGDDIEPTRQEVFFFATPPGDVRFEPDSMPSWVEFGPNGIFYGCPDVESRGFKAAADKHGGKVDPDTMIRIPSPEGLEEIRALLQRRFPAIGASPCVETRVCQYENTRTGDFLIDRHPTSPNVWIVGGGSGHGFKHGPAVGEYVVSLMNGGAT